VDGSSGTGKTYLYRVLLAMLRSQDKIAVATATSGVAASLIPRGRTIHSRFNIPRILTMVLYVASRSRVEPQSCYEKHLSLSGTRLL
jgi:DNA helicase HerA-like ATPase